MESPFKQKKRAVADYRWYLTPDMTFVRASALISIAFCLCTLFFHSDMGKKIEKEVAWRFEYLSRQFFKKGPELDERIKIYAMGDSTIDYLQATDLKLKEWADLLKAMEPSHPRAVFIDKIFGVPDGLEGSAYFIKTLKSLSFPVIAGLFLAPRPIGKRPSFDLTRSDYEPAFYGAEKTRVWEKNTPLFAYGPHSAIQEAFQKVGHLNYQDGYTIRPLEFLNERAIPEAAFLLSEKLRLQGQTLEVNSSRVLLTEEGLARINWIAPEVLAKKTYRLASIIEKARKKEVLTQLPEGGVVVILPGMTTGDSDIQPGPFGLVPGGYIQVSLINSILTGQFIAQPFPSFFTSVLGALFSLLFVLPLSSVGMLVLFFAVNLMVTGAGIYSFVAYSSAFPWLYFVISFSVPALMIFFERLRASDSKAQKIREALSGSISPGQLQHLLSHSKELEFDPSGQVVSMLFVDIAGFSRTVERQTPTEAFRHLKAKINSISEIVHEHGGVIDKTYGDGLLCFFGYNYGLSLSYSNHAEQALKCAIAIQQNNAERILHFPNEPIFPLRIGLNTSNVYIGDFGSAERIDLTLIGHGVNIAKRLESACDNHRIMLGEGTAGSIPQTLVSLDKRLIQIKHSYQLFEAYECSPISSDVEKELDQRYFKQSGFERSETRTEIAKSKDIRLVGPNGAGRVLNFSHSGFGALFSPYLGRGVSIAMSVTSADGKLEKKLESLGLVPILCDVRWGKKVREGYLIGFQIKNHTEQQNTRLVEELEKYLSLKPTKLFKRAS